ncbi:hypothetical protein WR25_22759 [Diploscapter pachys]|uniref:Uncharacterized protein n=1 Tax=Diploscapter pachys TaxID=2018661 RepID=A0A2A2K697_9BILA|nr:hypothetical protein WR25_22759 [Diploscapter pachys]
MPCSASAWSRRCCTRACSCVASWRPRRQPCACQATAADNTISPMHTASCRRLSTTPPAPAPTVRGATATVALAIAVSFGRIAQAQGQDAGVVAGQVLVVAQLFHIAQLAGLMADLGQERGNALRVVDLPVGHGRVQRRQESGDARAGKWVDLLELLFRSAFARRHRETVSTTPQALSVPTRLGAEPLALALPWRPPLHCTVVRQPLLVNTCSTDSIR